MLDPSFDPMRQPYWTLPMCVAWVAYRTPEAVQTQLNAFRTNECGLPEADLNSLLIEEADKDHLPPPQFMTCTRAMEDVWLSLQAGHLIGHGLGQTAASHSAIAPTDWLRLEADKSGGAVKTLDAQVAKGARIVRYMDVRVSVDDVLRLWAAPAQEAALTTANTKPLESETFQLSRWPLLVTLAWIMSRDEGFTSAALGAGKRVHSLDVSRSVALVGPILGLRAPPRFIFDTVQGAFVDALAPAMAMGRIKGVGYRRLKNKLSGMGQNIPDVFPSGDMPPEAAFMYDVGDEPGGSLEPRGSRFSHERWIFTDLTFAREEVLALWPAAGPVLKATSAERPPQRRGRKDKYPWEKVRALVLERFEDEGSPPATECEKGWRTKSDLELFIQELCSRMTGEECSRSVAGGKAAEWIADWDAQHRSG